MLHRYAFCGDIVESTMPLPELVPVAAPDGHGAATWRCAPGVVPPASACAHMHEWFDPEGQCWLRLSRAARGYRLAFSVGVRFFLDGLRVQWETDPDVPPHTLRHLLLDQVLPLALSGRGAFVFHGASVAIDGAAVLFVGASGSGKSTLAGWCDSQGDEFLADDCVRVHDREGVWSAQAAYPALRVWPDSAELLRGCENPLPVVAHYSRKVRVDVRPPSQSVLPLRRIYLLRDAPSIDPLMQRATAASVVELVRYLFKLDITDRNALSEDFTRLTRLVLHDLVRYLYLPVSFAGLARVRHAVIADLQDVDAAACCA